MYITFHLFFCLLIFVNLIEKELSGKFYGVFDHFSGIFEITKFWMTRQCLKVNDAIPINEHE